MSSVTKSDVERLREWLNLALAVILFVSPWVLGFAGEQAPAWTAWGTGIVIADLAVVAVLQFSEWEAWAALVLGVWLVISPWLMGFTHIMVAQWALIVLGLLVAAVGAWELWSVRFHRSATT